MKTKLTQLLLLLALVLPNAGCSKTDQMMDAIEGDWYLVAEKRIDSNSWSELRYPKRYQFSGGTCLIGGSYYPVDYHFEGNKLYFGSSTYKVKINGDKMRWSATGSGAAYQLWDYKFERD